jgi:hypothetical protein
MHDTLNVTLGSPSALNNLIARTDHLLVFISERQLPTYGTISNSLRPTTTTTAVVGHCARKLSLSHQTGTGSDLVGTNKGRRNTLVFPVTVTNGSRQE